MEKLQPNKWVEEAEEKNAHTAAAASEDDDPSKFMKKSNSKTMQFIAN